jgi:PAS domain-containing protein
VPQHVEFSISDLPAAVPSLERWGATVDGALEACLVIDAEQVVVAMSESFEEMLGLDESPVSRPLLQDGGVLQLLDFADGKALEQTEVARMPPVLALTSGRLARGLIRIRCAPGPRTFDAIATPLIEDGKTVGSLTFFSLIN